MPEITVQFPDGMTRTFTPEIEEELFFGRDVLLGADVALASPLVSRRHAKMWVDGEGELRIEHVSKVNQSLVNDEAITDSGPRLLSDGDKITIQPFVLTVNKAAGNGGSGESIGYHIGVSVSEGGGGRSGSLPFPAAPGVPGAPFGMVPGLPGSPGSLATIRAPSSEDLDDSEPRAANGLVDEAEGPSPANEPMDEAEAPSVVAEEVADAPVETPAEEPVAEAGPEESFARADEREVTAEVGVPEMADPPPAPDLSPPAAGDLEVAETDEPSVAVPEAGFAEDDVAEPDADAPDEAGLRAGLVVPEGEGEPEGEYGQGGGFVGRAERSVGLGEEGQTTREPLAGVASGEDDAPVSGRFRRMAASVMSRFSGDVTDRDDDEVTARRPVEGMQPKLVLRSALDGMTPNEQLPIYESPATVGSSGNCTITLNDRTVSDCHAELERVGLEWFVTDLQSTNGVFVNDLPIRAHEAHPISDLDLIRFGTVEVQFLPEEAHTVRVGPGEREGASQSGATWRRKAILTLLSAAALLIALLGVQVFMAWREAGALEALDEVCEQIKAVELVTSGKSGWDPSTLDLEEVGRRMLKLRGFVRELERRAPAAGESGPDRLLTGRKEASAKVTGLCKKLAEEPRRWLTSDKPQKVFEALPVIEASLAPIEEILGHASDIVSAEEAAAWTDEVTALQHRRRVLDWLRTKHELADVAFPEDEEEFLRQMQRLRDTIESMRDDVFRAKCETAGYSRMHTSILGRLESRRRGFMNSNSYERRAYEALTGLLDRDLEPEHRERKAAIAEEWLHRVARSDLRNRGIRACEQCSMALMAFREAGACYREQDYDRMARMPTDLVERLPTEMLKEQCKAQVAYCGLLSREAARWERTYGEFTKAPQLAAASLLKKLRDIHDDVSRLEGHAYLLATSLSKRRLRRLALAAYYAEEREEALSFAQEVSPSLSRKLCSAMDLLKAAADKHRTGLESPGRGTSGIEKAEREFVREAAPDFEYRPSRRMAVITSTGHR